MRISGIFGNRRYGFGRTDAAGEFVLRDVPKEIQLAERVAQGGRDADPFICSVQAHRRGQPLQRHALRRRFFTARKALGRDRLRTLTIHHERHTFIGHALAGGRTLAEVRDAAGHSSVLVTIAYLHVAVEETGEVGSLFGTG